MYRINCLFGIRSFGKEMIVHLKKQGITVEAFIDKNAENIGSVNGTNVYTLENYNGDRKTKTVIVAIVCDKDIRNAIFSDIKKKQKQVIV